jgi:hypothetical protein
MRADYVHKDSLTATEVELNREYSELLLMHNQILSKENYELKKQVEDTINSYTEEHNLRHNSDLKLDVLLTQQQEFINFLEDNYKETQDIWYIKILQKYKEIIGDDK